MMKKILILGSGGLRIGQAGEFDYSGSQAIKALKEEGYLTLLVNPNIATVQTDPGQADEVFLLPLNLKTVTQIIAKTRPQGLLLSFGGQTALNLGLQLEEAGVLKKYGVKVLGTPPSAIRLTEDRDLFKQALLSLNVKTPKSFYCKTVEEALHHAQEIGYPIMIRSGFSLGGLGAGRIADEATLIQKANETLKISPHILVEEFLTGYKELEFEMVRDRAGNALAICHMENLDPMGIHTGESIVVAPCQTLSDAEIQNLRSIALKIVRHLKIVGECNVQFALNPLNGDYRVIEVNARLSRSSALASKATGYPLAFVAAKLALGHLLHEIPNGVTKKTTAFFEPSLDYIVVKIPRWDMTKLKAAERTIGSEMKSVGEVMGIGRSFLEALQKAIRMLHIGCTGLTDYPSLEHPKKEIERPTDRRLFALYQAFKEGSSIQEIHKLSHIHPWFLAPLVSLVHMEKRLQNENLTPSLLKEAKKMGLSDKAIGKLRKKTEEEMRSKRLSWGLHPVFKQIDTLAGEFPACTNYLYATYWGDESDVKPSKPKPIVILGSGPYSIGSSVEFDWCCVNTVRTLKKEGVSTIMINSNPETVSTDYDEPHRLYFEELTLERISDILDFESPKGVILSVGGQGANNLAAALDQKGYPLLGTQARDIDQAENRKLFSSLLEKLNIDQPAWTEASSLEAMESFIDKVGFPILIRPSYVLSGAAMNVIEDRESLSHYLKEALIFSREHPVVLSQFIENAKEIEVDAVAYKGRVLIQAISEHIENAGVHSGDATVVLPPQRLYLETIRRVKKIGREIALALNITGPFNLQFIAKDNHIKVIECNVRASRSFPFVSKVTGYNFIEIATRALLGKPPSDSYETLELDYVGVKTPIFSYQRLKGANPVAHVEMASTGEVACLGQDLLEAFFTSWMATEQQIQGKRLMVSIGGDRKPKLLEPLRELERLGWDLYATENTHKFLSEQGIGSTFLYKISEGMEPNIGTLIKAKKIDLILNIPTNSPSHHKTDGYQIRRLAIDHHIPLITNLQIAQLFLQCLIEPGLFKEPKSWQEFLL